MSRTSYRIPEFGTWFGCMKCPDAKGMSKEELVEHLKTVHFLESPIKGSRRMNCHLDCEGYYTSLYEWVFGDIKVAQETVGPRSYS